MLLKASADAISTALAQARNCDCSSADVSGIFKADVPGPPPAGHALMPSLLKLAACLRHIYIAHGHDALISLPAAFWHMPGVLSAAF